MLLTPSLCLFKLFLILLSIIRTSVGDGSKDTICVASIQEVLEKFVFVDTVPGASYINYCTTNLSVTSLWAAAKLYCTDAEIAAGYELWNGYCIEYGEVILTPYEDVLPVLSDAFIATLPVVEFKDIAIANVWNTSILPSNTFFNISSRTITTWNKAFPTHTRYGWAVYGFWGGIVLIGILNRIITLVLTSRHNNRRDIEQHQPIAITTEGPLGAIRRWTQTYLIIPAAFGSHHQRLLYACTIPTRAETIVVAAFWILSLILCCVTYDVFYPNLYYVSAQQVWRYVADRTGMICYANLPILWMLSGRNNIFQWLTGWNFATFNLFHRHVARITTIEAIVHSVAYTVLVVDEQSFAASWKENYFYMGGMATICMSLLLVLSSVWLRRKAYEVFLVIHIVFSILVIVGLFYHTAIFEGAYEPYLWPVVAIWIFERFARLVRLVYCNLRLSSGHLTSTHTTATYDKEADIVRIQVTQTSRMLKPEPGQHYFLYQPMGWKGYENHPLSLASWTATEMPDSSRSSSSEIATANDKDLQVTISIPTDAQNPSTTHDALTFYARPYGSWTQRLRNECLKSPTGSINPTILLEGPYGHQSPLHRHENVLLIVGGAGITAALPYIHDHILRKQTDSTKTRQLTLVWTTKQPAMIHTIAQRELRHALAHSDMDFHFFATGKPLATTAQKDVSEQQHRDSETAPQIAYGRPDIPSTIYNAVDSVAEAGTIGGGIAVLCCGPAAMADEARATVAEAMRRKKVSAAYFEEAFGW